MARPHVFEPAGFIAGVDIGGTRLRMRLADGHGKELAAWSTLLSSAGKTPEDVRNQIHEGLNACCSSVGLPLGKLLHLAVGAPGVTDSRAGVVISAPNLTNWNHVPLRDLLQRGLGVPVSVENDTNLAALGEHHAGAARDADNLVFLAVGTGLGAGILVNGRLLAGAHWSAGEVGYFGVRNQPREVPRVRETGQIERVVGGDGIERRWRDALPSRGESDPALFQLRASQILDQAQAGDSAAIRILHATATLLADAITDIALVLDPELVVLGGGVGSHPALCPAVEACLSGNEFARPRVRSSALGPEAQLAGAIAVSLAAVGGLAPS